MELYMPAKTFCLLACVSLALISNAQNVPRSSHVWMITEENHSFEDVVGN